MYFNCPHCRILWIAKQHTGIMFENDWRQPRRWRADPLERPLDCSCNNCETVWNCQTNFEVRLHFSFLSFTPLLNSLKLLIAYIAVLHFQFIHCVLSYFHTAMENKIDLRYLPIETLYSKLKQFDPILPKQVCLFCLHIN